MNLSIAITSCNRMHYTKALLNSLKPISKAGAEIVLVDNCSTEEGLSEYLLSLEGTLINKLELRTGNRDWINDEYIAKNKLIELSSNEVILFLQDDCQFVAPPEVLKSYVDDFCQMNALSMSIAGVRKSTLKNWTQNSELLYSSDKKRKYWHNRMDHFSTTGLFKAETFKVLGPQPVNWPSAREYWGRSEDYYDQLVTQKYSGQYVKSVISHVPLYCAIWNDPRGGYAFIRDDHRYGHYLTPTDESHLYYKILSSEYIESLMKENQPASFVDVANPLGWHYARQNDGDQLKYGQDRIMREGPKTIISTGKLVDLEIEEPQNVDSYLKDWLSDNT